MQPDLFWAVVLGGCFIALALIAIPNNPGMSNDHGDDRTPHNLRNRLERTRREQARNPQHRAASRSSIAEE
jgi:hypothetical protein